MKRTASAVWTGGLKDGKGSLSTPSGALKNVPYGFSMRFEDAPGTNPEELIAAAHAGCFSMALANSLATAGFVATSVQTVTTKSCQAPARLPAKRSASQSTDTCVFRRAAINAPTM